MHDATVVLIYTYIAGTNVVPVPFYGGCGVYKKKRHPRGWYRRGTGTFETAWVPWTRFKDFACASMIHRGLSYSAQAACSSACDARTFYINIITYTFIHAGALGAGHELLAGDVGARAGARGRLHATPQPHRSSAWTWKPTFSRPPPTRGPTGLGVPIAPRTS